MANPTRKSISNQIIRYKKYLESDPVMKLNSILGSETFLTIIEQCREYRERIFTPFITLMVFITQVLDPDKSCKKALTGFIGIRMGNGQKPCSANTGPYCKARQKIPESTIKKLVDVSGKEAKHRTPLSWKWKGRDVNVVDGTTLLAPDTLTNVAAYPKHKNHAEGVGLPIMRLLVIFSLATGVVLEYAMDTLRGEGTGEPSLLKRVMNNVMTTGDILLGDCGFHSFFLLIDLMEMGCDGLFQAHPYWKFDYRKGKKLAEKDYIVRWRKPKRRPPLMDPDTYRNYPKFLLIRVFTVGRHAYITTMFDNKKYHKNELGELYRFRWQAELHLGSIKTIMGMDRLSCKTPEMVRKEIGVHLLAYNIIRIIMAEASTSHGVRPMQISFKGAVQFVNSFMPALNILDKETRMEMYKYMLWSISNGRVGNRPGRKEPRAIKQRPKQFPLLKKHRNEYRKDLYNPKQIKAAA